jgi:hypothetical protein
MPPHLWHSGQVGERGIIDLLVRRYAFAEVAAVVAAGGFGAGRTERELAEIEQLCAFGKRLLDLDAEDFGNADAATDANVDHGSADNVIGGGVPPDLVIRSHAARMPQSPHEIDRGALASLRPAFSLILEVIAARWMRRETSDLVAALHIASEYLPMLIWEPVLGHAGDPARMPASVGGAGSRWGHLANPDCPHSTAQKSAAHRALLVEAEPDLGWRNYLDRQHSLVSAAFGVCAADCPNPCTVMGRHAMGEQAALMNGCGIAKKFTESALIQLRHSAPVGHGFGVPSRREVMETWTRTRSHLGSREPAVLVDDGFVLPGLASFVSALAGAAIVPDTLIADTATALQAALK